MPDIAVFAKKFFANKRLPRIPAPEQNISSLHRTVTALKEAVEVLSRQRGDKLDSAVTIEELYRYGIPEVQQHRPLCRIRTGSYAGDGATSLSITGIGFKPLLVLLFERATADATAVSVHVGMTEIVDDNASGGAIELTSAAITFETNTVISLDGDGFTVDDAGADAHPNKNGTTYNYIVFG